jgi:hypothetical protein
VKLAPPNEFDSLQTGRLTLRSSSQSTKQPNSTSPHQHAFGSPLLWRTTAFDHDLILFASELLKVLIRLLLTWRSFSFKRFVVVSAEKLRKAKETLHKLFEGSDLFCEYESICISDPALQPAAVSLCLRSPLKHLHSFTPSLIRSPSAFLLQVSGG